LEGIDDVMHRVSVLRGDKEQIGWVFALIRYPIETRQRCFNVHMSATVKSIFTDEEEQLISIGEIGGNDGIDMVW